MTYAPEQLVPGARLGKYEIIRSLAMGGMAELFLARAHGIEGFEKLVVLKRILPQFARDERFVSMFLDEARLAATLHHPNLAQVYDIGFIQQSHFFAMEYVHGHTLLDLLRNEDWKGRGLSLGPAITVALGLVAGLHYAHEKRDLRGNALNIVHRDVSPSNVMVTCDGQVKLVDFGIAKATSQQSITQAGTLKGKLPYMSPEQIMCAPLDRRSDVYAVGVVLYEMTTGQRLFRAENDLAMARKIVDSEFATPTLCRTGYPEALATIVLRALQANANDRHASARELQSALEQFALDQRIITSPTILSEYMREVLGEQLSTSDVVFPTVDTATGTQVDFDAVGSDSAPAHVALVSQTPVPQPLAARPAAPRRWRRWTMVIGACGLLLGLLRWSAFPSASEREDEPHLPPSILSVQPLTVPLSPVVLDAQPAPGPSGIASTPGQRKPPAADEGARDVGRTRRKRGSRRSKSSRVAIPQPVFDPPPDDSRQGRKRDPPASRSSREWSDGVLPAPAPQ